MTGGIAVILGDFGRNFAAGMSGGIAYIYNEDNIFDVKKFNLEMIELEDLLEDDTNELKVLLKNHLKYTKSPKANYILKNWSKSKHNFIKVMPTDYKRALKMISNKETEKTI